MKLKYFLVLVVFATTILCLCTVGIVSAQTANNQALVNQLTQQLTQLLNQVITQLKQQISAILAQKTGTANPMAIAKAPPGQYAIVTVRNGARCFNPNGTRYKLQFYADVYNPVGIGDTDQNGSWSVDMLAPDGKTPLNFGSIDSTGIFTFSATATVPEGSTIKAKFTPKNGATPGYSPAVAVKYDATTSLYIGTNSPPDTLSKNLNSVAIGKTLTLYSKAYSNGGTVVNVSVDYSSNNQNIATVANNGVITGVSNGSTIINGISDDCARVSAVSYNGSPNPPLWNEGFPVSVGSIVPLTQVTISCDKSSVTNGGVVNCSTTIPEYPLNANDYNGGPPNTPFNYTWSVSNTTLGTIDQSGKFTANGHGELGGYVNIDLKPNGTNSDVASNSVSLTIVPAKPITSISLNPFYGTQIPIGQSVTYTATVTPSDPTIPGVTWSQNPGEVGGIGVFGGATVIITPTGPYTASVKGNSIIGSGTSGSVTITASAIAASDHASATVVSTTGGGGPGGGSPGPGSPPSIGGISPSTVSLSSLSPGATSVSITVNGSFPDSTLSAYLDATTQIPVTYTNMSQVTLNIPVSALIAGTHALTITNSNNATSNSVTLTVQPLTQPPTGIASALQSALDYLTSHGSYNGICRQSFMAGLSCIGGSNIACQFNPSGNSYGFVATDGSSCIDSRVTAPVAYTGTASDILTSGPCFCPSAPTPPSCTDGYVLVAGSCQPCDSSCETCSDTTSSGCLTCPGGYALNGTICSPVSFKLSQSNIAAISAAIQKIMQEIQKLLAGK